MLLDISNYIKELLFIHDCVIIPEFGGLLAKYIPADVSHDSSGRFSFHPPAKQIAFNNNLKQDDGLLINHICKQEGITYKEAQKQIQDTVQKIIYRLHNRKKVYLTDIGYFKETDNKTIGFEPENTTNFLIESYGLPVFDLEPLERNSINKRLSRSKEPVKQALKSKTAKRILIALPIAVALAFVPFHIDDFKNLNTQKLSFADNFVFDTTQTQKKKRNKVTERNTRDTLSPKQNKTTQQNIYYLIAGSFSTYTNAAQKQGELLKSGYEASIIESDNGFFRVTIAKYMELPKAQAEKNKLIQTDNQFAGIWILTKPHL